MANCISCGKEIAEGSRFCEYCGAPQNASPNPAETVLLGSSAEADPAATVLLSPPPDPAPEPAPSVQPDAPDYGSTVPPQQGMPGYGGAIPPQQSVPDYGSAVPPQQGMPSYGGAVPPQQGTPGYGGAVPPQQGTPGYGSTVPPQQGVPGYGSAVPPQQGVPGYGSAVPPQQGVPGYGATYGQGAAPVPPAPRKKMPLGAKIALIVVAVLVVAVAAAWFILNKIFSAEGTIEDFTDAVAAQDFEAFSKVTCSADEGLELTEEAVAPFFALYSSDTYALDDFQKSLLDDLDDLKAGEEAKGNGTVRLIEHNYFLFKRYEIELSGVKFEFETSLAGATVSVGGQTVTMSPTTGSVTLLPGRYDVTASYTDSRLGETFTYEEKDCGLTGRGGARYLPIPYHTMYLEDTGIEIATLTVNGVDYGPVQFDGNGEMELSPLPPNAEVSVTFNMGGATLGDTMICPADSDWSYFYPELSITGDLRSQLSLQAGQFLLDMASVVSANDVSSMGSLMGQVSEYSSFLSNMNEWLVNNEEFPENRTNVIILPTRILCEEAWGVTQYNGSVNFTCHMKMEYYYAYQEYWDGELWEEYEEPESYDVFTFTFAPQGGGWTIRNMDVVGYYYFTEDGAQTIYG